jgi:hypothetical protein
MGVVVSEEDEEAVFSMGVIILGTVVELVHVHDEEPTTECVRVELLWIEVADADCCTPLPVAAVVVVLEWGEPDETDGELLLSSLPEPPDSSSPSELLAEEKKNMSSDAAPTSW